MPAIAQYALLATLIASATANSAISRDSYVYRDGTKLKIDGQHFTTSGANVYWLVRPFRLTCTKAASKLYEGS